MQHHAKLIKQICEEMGSQAALAHALGVHRNVVWKWLHGRTTVPHKEAYKISRLTENRYSMILFFPELSTWG